MYREKALRSWIETDDQELRDELLVVRCQLGELQAFDELIRNWSRPLLRHIGRIVGDDNAEDVAQEVWLRALRGIARLRDGTKLRPWLFRIAHHVVMDRLRMRYRDIAAETELLAMVPEGNDASPETVLALLESRLASLPVIERETLSLFYLEQMSLLEIAEIQAVPAGTVKSRLFRARQMLRQSMLSEEEMS